MKENDLSSINKYWEKEINTCILKEINTCILDEEFDGNRCPIMSCKICKDNMLKSIYEPVAFCL